MSKKQSEKVRNALKTLEVNRRFSQDKMTCGLGRVDRCIEDIESDWLEQWSDQDSENLQHQFKE